MVYIGLERIIGAEASLVKTLHPIDTISSRVSQSGDRVVRLVRAVDDLAVPGNRAAPDPMLATIQALADPLGFPPLSAATVPGDRVAIVVADAVPCAAGIVRAIVDALRRAGIDDDVISIVTTSSEFSRLCRTDLDSSTTCGIHSVVHDPGDEQNLCFVGILKRGEPLLVNRTIYDADVVLPIGCARLGGYGVFESLYPAFSSTAALARYRTPAKCDSKANRTAMERETEEASRLIGAPLLIQVVPGVNESVAGVLAGAPRVVAERTAELFHQQWARRSPHRANLVIGTIGGGAASQTWENVARALAAAEPLVEEGGAIAICSNLDQPPGESLGRLIDSDDLAATQLKISHDHNEDSWPAWQLVRALERGPVYFLSQLDPDTVEELGMAPVADVDEVVRLAGRRESCIVLDDAQHVVVTVDGQSIES